MPTTRRSIYRKDVIYLDHQLALEDEPTKRQTLARRLKHEIDELEAAERKTITPRQAYSANYWKARAARIGAEQYTIILCRSPMGTTVSPNAPARFNRTPKTLSPRSAHKPYRDCNAFAT